MVSLEGKTRPQRSGELGAYGRTFTVDQAGTGLGAGKERGHRAAGKARGHGYR
uniref:Uncharacterized protein n=1 Tax=Oryza sativa subsp. japonica TaxID=39947 RepID=Q6ZKP6_ORYSJ|nr:hypothetical protein [Oryza sativa Japonica Group]